MDTKELRAERKSIRASLTAEQVTNASIDVAVNLWRLPVMLHGQHIAAYQAYGGEIDCRFIIEAAWRRGRKIYLPVIHNNALLFAQYCAKSRVFLNQYGIAEPESSRRNLLRPDQMDVILAPLVAFDDAGNRIGMGGGYYDRSLRFLKHRTHWQHPRLIGIAYEFQKAAKINASSWDIPLHNVVTEQRIYSCT